MKKLFKVLLYLVLIIGLIIGAVFFFTSGMVTSANGFFTAAGKNDIDKAYSYLSEQFKSSTSKVELQSYIENTMSSPFMAASWKSRSVSIGKGTLEGEVFTEDEEGVPFSLSFIKEQGDWKIQSMQQPAAGIQNAAIERKLPPEPEQITLVNESVMIFAESVNDKSMQKFHGHVSTLWQGQYSVEKFNEVFAPFLNLDVDLTVLQNYAPIFSSEASIDGDGVMQIIGHYPTEPQQFHFDQEFVFEGTSWKLIGFSAQIK